MAPLRTIKRFSHDTATKRDSKAVNRQDDAESEELTDPDVNTDSTDGEDQSQRDEPEETQSKSAQDLLSSMVAGARKRHIAKKRNVIKSYATTTNNVEMTITSLFDVHEDKSALTHEAQLKRLRDLISHKAKLEAAMEARLVALRASYDAHSRDLELVLNHRIKDLK